MQSRRAALYDSSPVRRTRSSRPSSSEAGHRGGFEGRGLFRCLVHDAITAFLVAIGLVTIALRSCIHGLVNSRRPGLGDWGFGNRTIGALNRSLRHRLLGFVAVVFG